MDMKELKELIEKILAKKIKSKIRNYFLARCLIMLIEIFVMLILIAIIVLALLFSFHYIREIFVFVLSR